MPDILLSLKKEKFYDFFDVINMFIKNETKNYIIVNEVASSDGKFDPTFSITDNFENILKLFEDAHNDHIDNNSKKQYDITKKYITFTIYYKDASDNDSYNKITIYNLSDDEKDIVQSLFKTFATVDN
jgi:hypothetical protein